MPGAAGRTPDAEGRAGGREWNRRERPGREVSRHDKERKGHHHELHHRGAGDAQNRETNIDINDEGIVKVSGDKQEGVERARETIELMTKDPQVGEIYDGTFSGKTVKGDGVTAALLKRNGIEAFTEEDCGP